jgi:hypothetical protein
MIADKLSQGQIFMNSLISIPYSSRIIHAIADPAPKVQPSYPYTLPTGPNAPSQVTIRRLNNLRDLVLPVDFNVPPPVRPEGLLNKINQFGLKNTLAKADQKERRMEDNRRILVGMPVQGNRHLSSRCSKN